PNSSAVASLVPQTAMDRQPRTAVVPRRNEAHVAVMAAGTLDHHEITRTGSYPGDVGEDHERVLRISEDGLGGEPSAVVLLVPRVISVARDSDDPGRESTAITGKVVAPRVR